MERVEYEWPADCSLAPSWDTSLYHILYSIERRAMVRLLSSVVRVESISVTLSLRSKRFRTQRTALLWTIWTVFVFLHVNTLSGHVLCCYTGSEWSPRIVKQAETQILYNNRIGRIVSVSLWSSVSLHFWSWMLRMSNKSNSFESDLLYFQKGPVLYKSWLDLNISREHANRKYISNIYSLFLFTIRTDNVDWPWYIIPFTIITFISNPIKKWLTWQLQVTQWRSNKKQNKNNVTLFQKNIDTPSLSTCSRGSKRMFNYSVLSLA